MRILVSGMVAGDPFQGGATWAVAQYVLGFRRLGHDVVVVEPVDRVDARIARYFEHVRGSFELDAALLVRGTRTTAGIPYGALRAFARDADVLVNISGMLRDPALLEPIPVRVYLDLDPAFNQLWHEQEALDVGFDGHTHFVTVGTAVDTTECDVPTAGHGWLSTLPPVVLDRWPPADGIVHDALTTVGNWRSYGSLTRDGVLYGQKAHSLRGLIDLPARTDERFLLALAIHPDESADLSALAENGWQLADPADAAGTPEAYRRFVRGSRAELAVAKSGYVVSRCGWFSDRSACYLASGRPVLAQDTGFGRALPTGEGLLAFETVDEALAGIEELRSDYSRHRGAARAIAEEHLDSDGVLDRLLACL